MDYTPIIHLRPSAMTKLGIKLSSTYKDPGHGFAVRYAFQPGCARLMKMRMRMKMKMKMKMEIEIEIMKRSEHFTSAYFSVLRTYSQSIIIST